jgi:hypothetical protein
LLANFFDLQYCEDPMDQHFELVGVFFQLPIEECISTFHLDNQLGFVIDL